MDLTEEVKKAPRKIPRFGRGDVVGCGVAKLKESLGPSAFSMLITI